MMRILRVMGKDSRGMNIGGMDAHKRVRNGIGM
jgi:hypothetical protein